ncbi:MAG: JAB domain-containing protein [Bacteroidetes bacterium SW_11_64_17]|nr:MAG: JAB domain-containing protein [Bacteroidetes bacterium SW_11_64_17]
MASPSPPPDATPDDSSSIDGSEEPALLYHVPIHEWDESDQPREKLLKHGPTVLSDAEVLALLLGSGTRTNDGPVSAVELGRSLLQSYGSLHGVSQRKPKELKRMQGVGPAKASKLAEAQRQQDECAQVTCPDDVADAYGPLLRDLDKEVFKVVHLNTANVIIGDYTVSEGGLSSSVVEPRGVFEQAILDDAAAVICLHNHPSGNPEPSREDIRITRQLVEAGDTMGIPVHDHLIIAGTDHTSLAERGVID